jgi:predicted nucleic acid-binding protein
MTLLVPAFFWLEVVNVLGLRYRMEPALVLEAVVDLEKLRLETIPLDRPQLLLTIDVMAQEGLSAYDAGYLALAESADAQLVTADRRLAAAAGPRALRLEGGREIRETNQPYTGSWATWPGAAAYLKELRARIVSQANG